jgi:type I restriction enzyme, S subunit
MNKFPICEAADFINGRALKPSEWGTEGLPIIRIQNLTGTHEAFNFFSGTVDRKNLVKRGDILISWSASLGVYRWDRNDAALNQHIFKVVLKPGVVPSYFYYVATNALNQMVAQVHGSTMQHITKDKFDAIPISLPSESEQKRIAAILEKGDRLRRMRRYARQLGDTFLQSVFLEMFGDIDKEAARWERLRFCEVCEISDDSVDPKNAVFADLPQISSEDIESGSGELRKLRTSREKGIISVNFLVQPSEIVFSKIRPNLRKVAYPKIKALCSADIYPLRVVHSECDLYYVLFYLRGDSFSRVVTRIAESRSNIPKVNRDELNELTIPAPPLPLQQKFAAIVDRFERLRAQQREAERQAEHLFQTLLHRAFNSEL